MKFTTEDEFFSWAETHFEISSYVSKYLEDGSSSVVKEAQENYGHTGLYQLAYDLTEKFELENKGVEWFEKSFYDEIDNFIERELRGAPKIS